MIKDAFLDKLNNKQLESIVSSSKARCIIAGAGSGKTTTLTSAIYYLVAYKSIWPSQILAFTFTNKAAAEMRNKISKHGNFQDLNRNISTFHSFCLRFLRIEIQYLQRQREFEVITESAKKTILRRIYKKLNLTSQEIQYRSAINFISWEKKAKLLNIHHVAANKEYDFGLETKRKIYNLYIRHLLKENLVDFDDLIIFTNQILSQNKNVREKWQDKYKYVFIDEFQDTSLEQYEIFKMLAHKSYVCVVGDPDQSIYGWRGSYSSIFKDFNNDYNPVENFILEENYRSTNSILKISNALIKNNSSRYPKELWTDKKDDEKISLYEGFSVADEARWIVDDIEKKVKKGTKLKNMYVLYRNKVQSRALEQELMKNDINFEIWGGIKFFDRLEIKTLLYYFQLINNNSNHAFREVLNIPKKGIGGITINKIVELAEKQESKYYDFVVQNISGLPFSAKIKDKITIFCKTIESLKETLTKTNLAIFAQEVYEKTGLKKLFEIDHEINRTENVKEFISFIEEFIKGEKKSLTQLIDESSLYQNQDNEKTDNEEIQDSLTLMTIHSSKGLENDVIYLLGLNEGIIPSIRQNSDEEEDVEEERRVAYVAFTRAKKQLCLSFPRGKNYFGNELQKSRFLSEIIKFIDYNRSEELLIPSKKWRNPFISSGSTKDKIYKSASLFSKEIDYVINKDLCDKFIVGDTVKHLIYGNGVVLQIDEDTVLINFKMGIGKKQILKTHVLLNKKTKIQ